MRKVLLVDPVMMSHSLLYYRAALASSGFEETQFTLVTAVGTEEYRNRVSEFGSSQPRMALRLLETNPGENRSRWERWRAFGRSMGAAERMLRTESFDLVAYLNLDPVLVYFAFPVFRPLFRAHFRAGVAGTLFLDNGLRRPIVNTAKARTRAVVDFWILRRALASGGLRKVAFLDPWCAERAAERFQSSICGKGVDPVFFGPSDRAAARARFALARDDFVFLFFGFLSDRKGVVESLAMLQEAPLPKQKTVIVVAGPAAPELRGRLEKQLSATARKYRVIREDRHLQQCEMGAYFAAADCVVCVYREFTGSSNVLIQAAAHGKLALVSSGGAMGDAVRRHGFGEVVDWYDRRGFVDATCRLAGMASEERQTLAERARRYAAGMDARWYMSQFFSGHTQDDCPRSAAL